MADGTGASRLDDSRPAVSTECLLPRNRPSGNPPMSGLAVAGSRTPCPSPALISGGSFAGAATCPWLPSMEAAMPERMDFIRARQRMVEQQLAARGIRDERVLDAMRQVPREAFIPVDLAEFAHHDGPVPIGEEQTISQPYVVALMLEAAAIGPQDKALEVGAGSGYVAALIARMARKVHAIERHAALAEQATQRLQRLGYDNAEILCADGTEGWPAAAPFDAIIVSAGSPDIPGPLKRQLAIGGRLVIPVGLSDHGQMLTRLTRRGQDAFASERLAPVSFVPLIGRHGWAPGEGE